MLSHLIHAVAADLHFYPSTLLTHQGDMECLVTISLRMVEPVAQTVGMTLVYLADGYVDVEAFVHFIFSYLRSENDANGENVIDFVERHVLVLHLVPNGIRTLDTCLDLIFHA